MNNELTSVRDKIDAIDDQLVALLTQRFTLVNEVAKAKRASGKAVSDPNRERDILTRVASATIPAYEEAMERIFTTIFASAKAQQRQILGGELPRAKGEKNLVVAIVGLGLIGGSFYKASREAGYETIGVHHRDNGEIIASADLIFVCLPPFAIVQWIKSNREYFKKGAIVVDICGNKTAIVSEMEKVEKDGWLFVGGHPMAGREVAGFENSLADLFVGASMILTPGSDATSEQLAMLKSYFSSIGFSQTVIATSEEHDDMIAFTSQLCHIIATTYARDKRVEKSVGFSAGSYANMTRIATQNEDDWSALYLANEKMLLPVLDGFRDRFDELRDAIATRDSEKIKKIIREGTAAKTRELAIVRN